MNPIRKHNENGKDNEPSKKESLTKTETDIPNEQCESNTLTTSTDVESVYIQQPINLMDRQDCRLLAAALAKSEAQRSKLQRKLIRSQSKVKAMKLEFQKTADIKEQYESLKETMVELQELLSQQVKAQEASDEITQSLREELETMTTKYSNLEADYMALHESKSFTTLCPQTPNVPRTPTAPKLQMITNSNHELVQKQNRQLKGANRKMKEQIGKLVDEMIVLRQEQEKRDQEIQESNTSEIARQNLEYGKQIAKLRALKYNEKKKYAKTLDELREEIAIMKEEKKVLVAGQNQVEIAHLRAETAQLSRSLAHVRVAKSSLEQKVAKLSELMTLDSERVFN